ncbi:MAG: DUF3783 domain-containing protein [Clostridia bacterium]|nr:DUF3783 domain-containing protein [Clostridia bacterium]
MPKVLAFNIEQPEKVQELSILALRLNYKLITVPCRQQGCLIRDLLDGRDTPPAPGVPFEEEMLVFYGFEHEDLNFLLNELIRTNRRVALKAVVTATNVEWTASQLYLQLKKENMEMKKPIR